MIFGLIPIGGKGLRLGLPYSKEMLPQKNFDIYNPVVNHLVEKMLLAGAEQIVFVHGIEFKQDVKDFFISDKFKHILQDKLGFANVVKDFLNKVESKNGDKVLFGLPDSVFNSNPFVEMLLLPGTVAGCFTTSPYSKVDRLTLDNSKFQVKTSKNLNNQDRFWGVIKFDIEDIRAMFHSGAFELTSEIGSLLNEFGFKVVNGDKYLDLGTWEGYNRYLSSTDIGVNNEIEKKYDASGIDPDTFEDFMNFATGQLPLKITSTDHYFTSSNENIEFIRYRENSDDEGAVPDITVKNYNSSQFNRFELTVPLSKNASRHNVIHLLSLLGVKFNFDVTKHCIIYRMPGYSTVYYTFLVNGKEKRIIEIELESADFNILTKVEETLSQIEGFSATNIIKKSKFQIIKESLND